MRKTFFIAAVAAMLGAVSCQNIVDYTQYSEVEPFEASVPEEWAEVDGVQASWGDIDVRYSKTAVPMHHVTDEVELVGWRGERVFAQAVVWTAEPVEKLTYEMTDLRGPGFHKIKAKNVRTGFVRSVVGDGFFSHGTGCGDGQMNRIVILCW